MDSAGVLTWQGWRFDSRLGRQQVDSDVCGVQCSPGLEKCHVETDNLKTLTVLRCGPGDRPVFFSLPLIDDMTSA